ncbi:MAG: alkylhydroperoxidase like protein AhpD family [Anaerosporomusa subterranea]|jgi:AhpD family alkylhydroperoxidase|nr:alkylhydroperoxidase like protein AhpD family [Anaerosporomusa subterranea]
MGLDSRITELISIGVSVGANCQPCLQYHVAKAKENGVSEHDIQEAITVGRTVRKGAAYKMDQYIATLWDGTSIIPQSTDKGRECGCTTINIGEELT